MTSVVADFDAVEEMNAEGPARVGKQANAGLAEKKYSVSCRWQSQKQPEAYLAGPSRLLISYWKAL